MKKRTPRRAAAVLLLCVATLMAALCCLAFPARANAADVMAYSKNDDGTARFYYSTDAALEAGYEGRTIYLACDWKFTGAMQIADSKSITIDMNGHKITNGSGSGSVINVNEYASLTLQSSKTTTFSYTGYQNNDGKAYDATIDTGGLVTACVSSATAAINVEKYAVLTLDNVAVAGNSTGTGVGAVRLIKKSTLNMKNGATIQHNYGGGVVVNGDDATIEMNASSISSNYGDKGGGIDSTSDATRAFLDNGSTISDNYASRGGGVFYFMSYFHLESRDKTGSISNNVSTEHNIGEEDEGGGGIYVDSRSYGSNEGTIKGLTISGNRAGSNGAGIMLRQEYTRVIECTFTGNEAGVSGGAIHVTNDENSVEGCTFTGNSCANAQDRFAADGAGGAIWVSRRHNLKVVGKTIASGNKNSRDYVADDIYLSSLPGATTAYITGGVDEGSSVGIRAYGDGECRVGEDITTYSAGTYFSDYDDHYITYGTDHDGDLWQRSGSIGYAVTINGQGDSTRYTRGSTVNIDGSSGDSSKAFWYWDAQDTVGLYPVSDFITDANKYDETLTFTMPQNDVDLAAVYADKTTKVTLAVARPVAGQALPTTATLEWGDGQEETVNITWLDENGAVATAAKYGAKYRISVSLPKNRQKGLFYSDGMTENDVTLDIVDEGECNDMVEEAYVTSAGELSVTTVWFETEKAGVESVEAATASVALGTSKADLLAALPDSAVAKLVGGGTAVLSTNKQGSVAYEDGLLSGDVVAGEAGRSYTVSIPLAASDKVPGAEGKVLEVSVKVLAADALPDPVLSPIPATYEVSELTGLQLCVTASCQDKDATIKYQFMGDDGAWGEEHVYDARSSTGIVLAGTRNDQAIYELRVWAEKSIGGQTVTSDYTEAAYVLDNTLNKTIEVNCSDTALYSEGETPWTTSFKVTGDLKSDVTIAAPAQAGRVFDHWEWASAPEGCDLTQATLTIKDFSTEYDGRITAVYKPVITTIDVEVAAPEAHTALPTSAKTVKIGVAGGSATTDVTKYLGAGALSWSPTAEGGASHLTTYTASLPLTAEVPAGVAYEMSDSVKVLVNGADLGASAHVAKDADGNDAVFIKFAATDGYKYQSLGAVDNVDLAFEEACGYKATQDAGKNASWGLPKEAQVTYACGETGVASIAWDKVEGFDVENMEAQELTATGTLTYSADVDAAGAPTTVTAKIKVAAAEKVVAPTATPEAGTYKGNQSVELACETEGATIRYTTDGTEPNAASTEYEGAISLTGSATVKARAFRGGMAASDVASFSYKITHEVAFDSKGGSAVASQVVEDGEKATKPADPVRDGYAFKGWYTKAGDAYDFSAAVTSDLKLVAKWEKDSEPVGRVQMLRLYNPYTGEHLYTSSEVEKAARVADGWNDEGKAWVAPSTGTEVHRLYNPYAPGGDHFYTTSAAEVEMLKAAGWSYEGVAWYSAGSETGVPVYRAYNPYAATGTHHYTVNAGEIENLKAAGWSAEGTAWYGLN